jgi:FixJ family two-component response regulator
LPTIAIVDDDPGVLASLVDLLESAGYATRSFPSVGSLVTNGLMGLDIIISDISMPDMNGFALRKLVKMSRPELPVFLITGRHELTEDELMPGVSGFFHKPFDARALFDALERVLAEVKLRPAV